MRKCQTHLAKKRYKRQRGQDFIFIGKTGENTRECHIERRLIQGKSGGGGEVSWKAQNQMGGVIITV